MSVEELNDFLNKDYSYDDLEEEVEKLKRTIEENDNIIKEKMIQSIHKKI